MTTTRRGFIALAAAAAAGARPAQAQTLDQIRLLAPAAPGSGWDQTARAMQDALQTGRIAGSVSVTNVPGAAGTVGLAQFVNQQRGDARSLLLTGLAMVGGILTNNSPMTLDAVVPVARLIGEYGVIVVKPDSPIRRLADITQRLRANPGEVSWAGGSAGSADHIMLGLIAKAIGVQPQRLAYTAFSGGGQAAAAIMGGHVVAGASGIGEWESQIRAGLLRAVAVSSPQRLPGYETVPTFKEEGVDVELANWRGVMGAPGISAEQRAALVGAVTRMRETESWRGAMQRYGWMDLFVAGDEFATFLRQNREQVAGVMRDLGLAR